MTSNYPPGVTGSEPQITGEHDPQQGPRWALGYPLEDLRAVAEVYREFDQPYALGAFSRVKENAVAQWLHDSECYFDDHGAAAAQVIRPERMLRIVDFTGTLRAHVREGAAVFRRVATLTGAGQEWLLEGLTRQWIATQDAPEVWLEGWVESPVIRRLAERAGLELVATKVKASSELVGAWATPGWVPSPWGELEEHDRRTLTRLEYVADLVDLVAEAAEEVRSIDGWADHYSGYNAKHAWSALGLTAYTAPGQLPDPAQIVKPSEMSKGWKGEHPDWDQWRVLATPLVRRLPAVERIVRHVSGTYGGFATQRVRLMRLQPGGGELTRHSDITDPDAGTLVGNVARLHVPLITNPDVRFRQWQLDGSQIQATMRPGELWYLDTRKPHRAGNYGTSERVHLVIDAYVTPELQQAIAEGHEAPAAEVE